MASKPQIPKHDAYAVWRIKDFRFFILARFTLTFGIQMLSLIVSWQVYSITKDPFSLGLVALAEIIPFLLIAMFGGQVADKYNRKKIIVFANILYLICGIGLLFLTFKFSFLFETFKAIPIYLLVVLTGLARGFIYPSQMALMAQIVPRENYANSTTWNSTAWHIAVVTGNAAGGLIVGFAGLNIGYLIASISIALGLMSFLCIKSRPLPAMEKKDGFFENLFAGVRFVFSNQILLGAMALDMFAVLFGGAVAMLPVFADTILHVGSHGLGFLRAAPAVGSVTMALILAYYPPTLRAGRNLLLGVAGFGVCMIFFAFSNSFMLSMVILALSGMCDNVSVIIRGTIMQMYTPDNMRGRVAAVNSIFIGSSNEIGAFESGSAARLMGLIPSVIFGGIMTLVVVGTTGKLAPTLRKLSLKTN